MEMTLLVIPLVFVRVMRQWQVGLWTRPRKPAKSRTGDRNTAWSSAKMGEITDGWPEKKGD